MKVSQKWRVAAVVLIGPALAMMDTTIVSIILSQLREAFHTDIQTINWVTSAYFLAQAAVIPVTGYLSDRIGSRVVYLAVLALFTTASLLCALAPTIEMLIVFRILQGIGGGALMPMAYAINYRTFLPNERGKLTSVVSIPILMAPTFGPTIGGYLSTSLNWNAVFLINVPLGIVALFLCLLILPRDKSDRKGAPLPQTKEARKSLDIPGLLLSMTGVTTLVYGISEAGSVGWGEVTVLTSLLIGTIILIVFVVVELRVSDPVLDLRIFMNSTFTITNIMMWLTTGGFIGGVFLLPLFFESVRGYTALIAGSFMISQGLANGVSMSVSGLLYNRLGPRILTLCGLFLLVGGTYGLTQINMNTTGQELQVWLILRGLGMGFVYQPMQTLALSVVSNKSMARASSLISVTRQMTIATAVAALTTYLTLQITTHTIDLSRVLQAGLQTHNLTGVAATCTQTAGPTQNPAVLEACVRQYALATGIANTYWIVLILSAACILLALTIGRDSAIEALKQAKLAKVSVEAAQNIPNVISPRTANGEEIMGPDILLWHHLQDNVVNSSLLAVESNQFCVLKSLGRIVNIYETGQYRVSTPDHPLFGLTQLSFSGEPIPWQYEVIYINRAKLVVKVSGVALSREMVEVDYRVDYTIHIATCDDAAQLVRRMPYRSHTLNIQEINTYAGPVIERTMNQLLQVMSLRQVQELQMQDLSQLVHRHLQPCLALYGITLDIVQVIGLSPYYQYI